MAECKERKLPVIRQFPPIFLPVLTLVTLILWECWVCSRFESTFCLQNKASQQRHMAFPIGLATLKILRQSLLQRSGLPSLDRKKYPAWSAARRNENTQPPLATNVCPLDAHAPAESLRGSIDRVVRRSVLRIHVPPWLIDKKTE